MFSMFAFLGQMLDRTRLDFGDKERFNELKKHFSKSLGGLGLTFMALSLTLVAAVCVWYFATHPAISRFLLQVPVEKNEQIIGPDGSHQNTVKVKEVLSSRSPRTTVTRMQRWVERAIMDSYTFNFTDADQVMKDVQIVFREDTYEKFLKEMNKKGGLIETTKDKSLMVSITPLSEVRVIKPGFDGTHRVWMVEMRAAIYISGALKDTPPPSRVVFKVLVQEVDPTRNPYGLVIAQISQSVSK